MKHLLTKSYKYNYKKFIETKNNFLPDVNNMEFIGLKTSLSVKIKNSDFITLISSFHFFQC